MESFRAQQNISGVSQQNSITVFSQTTKAAEEDLWNCSVQLIQRDSSLFEKEITCGNLHYGRWAVSEC